MVFPESGTCTGTFVALMNASVFVPARLDRYASQPQNAARFKQAVR